MVALTPQMPRLGRMAFSRLRASSTCTPRLLPSSSCHSSATNQSSWANSLSAPLEASSTCRLSGVVTSSWGMAFFWAARSLVEVSPVRRPTRQSRPTPSHMRRALSAISPASERSGVIQMALRPVALAGFRSALFTTPPQMA